MGNLNLLEVQKKLDKLNINLLTPLEFKRIFGVSGNSAQHFLAKYAKRGLFLRFKKGIYVNRLKMPPLFFIANKLYTPSYISFESALSYYQIVPETIYSITSATPKPTREFGVENYHLLYRRIKKESFAGYRPIQIEGKTVLIATPEKAVVDFYYFVALGKREPPGRIDFRKVDKGKLLEFAELFKNKKLINLIKNDYSRIH